MERKIGEIFELGGEWYQCIIGHCNQCSFDEAGTCKFIGNPHCAYRNDKKLACFKKLEKVGEPIVYMSRTFQRLKSPDTKQCKYCYFRNQVCNPQLCGKETFLVEIKQTKEDMEEKKLNLKPFDIQKAREGKPVCTRDGRPARIICFDRKGYRKIVALVHNDYYEDEIITYTIEGHRDCKSINTIYDLMMAPERHEGWVNVYQGGKLDADYLYPSKDDAVENISQPMKDNYIDTIKLTWEE